MSYKLSENVKHRDLSEFFDSGGSQCECLNASQEHTLKHALMTDTRDDPALFLESDCDEQLLIHVNFGQIVRVHSLILTPLPEDKARGPESIRLFVNKPTLDFDGAEEESPVQELKITADHLNGAPIELRYVLFQKVLSLTIFIPGNIGGSEVTALSCIKIFGTPAPQEGAKPDEGQQKSAKAADWLNSR